MGQEGEGIAELVMLVDVLVSEVVEVSNREEEEWRDGEGEGVSEEDL